MDLGTVIGIVVGFGLIVGSIVLNGSITAFIDVPSLLIVAGGTVAASLIAEKMPRVMGSIGVAKNAFKGTAMDAGKTLEKILEFSHLARRDGLLALEGQQVEDPFLSKALRMAVDGMDADTLRDTLTTEMMSLKQRHQRGQNLFKFMGATAPSMGMIGTLIGLVQMLQALDDPASIGPAMAVALLTTMYGAILAFVVFNPIAEKLSRYTAEESANMIVVIEGMDSIVRGHNAMVIRDKLEARFAPKLRKPQGEAA